MKEKNIVSSTNSPSAKRNEERKQRQANALRENLLRRKQQIRRRVPGDGNKDET